MKIKTVTITGADNSIDPAALVELSQEFPYVEWGFLLSRSREGTKRYTDNAWLEQLVDVGKGLKLSGHLCGTYVKEVIKGNDSFPYQEVFHRLNRVQLNFKGIKGLDAQPSHGFFELLRKWNKEVIFQITGENGHLFHMADVRGIKISLLFDASGGEGRTPASWPVPQKGVFCGYAGGLGPENLRLQLQKIAEAASNAEIWIDAESGLRSGDDVFDVEKVRAFLKIAKEWV
jgi:phosphoribosylanthranilate isomerase